MAKEMSPRCPLQESVCLGVWGGACGRCMAVPQDLIHSFPIIVESLQLPINPAPGNKITARGTYTSKLQAKCPIILHYQAVMNATRARAPATRRCRHVLITSGAISSAAGIC